MDFAMQDVGILVSDSENEAGFYDVKEQRYCFGDKDDISVSSLIACGIKKETIKLIRKRQKKGDNNIVVPSLEKLSKKEKTVKQQRRKRKQSSK